MDSLPALTSNVGLKRCLLCPEYERDALQDVKYFVKDERSEDGLMDFCIRCQKDFAAEKDDERRLQLLHTIQQAINSRIPITALQDPRKTKRAGVHIDNLVDGIASYYPGGTEGIFRDSAHHLHCSLTLKPGTVQATNAMSSYLKLVAVAMGHRDKEKGMNERSDEELFSSLADAIEEVQHRQVKSKVVDVEVVEES